MQHSSVTAGVVGGEKAVGSDGLSISGATADTWVRADPDLAAPPPFAPVPPLFFPILLLSYAPPTSFYSLS